MFLGNPQRHTPIEWKRVAKISPKRICCVQHPVHIAASSVPPPLSGQKNEMSVPLFALTLRSSASICAPDANCTCVPLFAPILKSVAAACVSDARQVATQSSPDNVWARVPGWPGGQTSGQPSGQPGGYRGFDFSSERSMLHAHELTAAHAESGAPSDGNPCLVQDVFRLRKDVQHAVAGQVYGCRADVHNGHICE